MEPVLIDTSVIIGVLQAHDNALGAAERLRGEPKAVTDAIVGELLAGARNKREFAVLLRHLQDNFMWLSATEQSSLLFRKLLLTYGPFRGVHLVDWQIASVAMANNIPLLTLNKKHVASIEGLVLA